MTLQPDRPCVRFHHRPAGKLSIYEPASVRRNMRWTSVSDMCRPLSLDSGTRAFVARHMSSATDGVVAVISYLQVF